VMSEMAFSAKEADELEEDLKDITLGEAESAYSSTQFISNVIIEQQKKNKLRKKRKIKHDIEQEK